VTSDFELKNRVLAELEFEPSVKVEDIGVSVKEGIVTLNGLVGDYAEKLAAASAAKRVAGVKGLADELVVELPTSSLRTDSDIAAAAVNGIRWITTVPEDAVKVTVRGGWLSLEGAVEEGAQRIAVENAVRYLAGVRGLTNLIAIKPKVPSTDVKREIEAAFERHALLDAKQIKVETTGGKVVLRGNVRSFTEREEAERAAWAAPGVSNVENRIILAV
jgi:osmotically-inducible protein OsmY